ncbi:hypothetical protein GLAREA_00290 [Glarea lozoyensis ATCC 20868]|uniref:Uncharacterized protein n=1 Tax=Glarea lozoyensis (strain ATCC 20868 / MF5171) TaxID=1116229 RepID=S3CRN6_GLAL2|nr:uncharacterized protein GLAREA_00290 [Glarea lozoyensis ATCC 20868]EPE29132.1 hypothetical protein GLAREA_00290 [Glarea lozoyensis ATCC 20868]
MSRYDEPRSVLMRGANDIPGEMSDGEVQPAARWKPQLRTPKSRTEFKSLRFVREYEVEIGNDLSSTLHAEPPNTTSKLAHNHYTFQPPFGPNTSTSSQIVLAFMALLATAGVIVVVVEISKSVFCRTNSQHSRNYGISHRRRPSSRTSTPRTTHNAYIPVATETTRLLTIRDCFARRGDTRFGFDGFENDTDSEGGLGGSFVRGGFGVRKSSGELGPTTRSFRDGWNLRNGYGGIGTPPAADVDVGGIWKDVMNEYPDGKKDDTKKTYTWKSLCKKTKKKHYARVQGYKTPKDDEAEVVQIEYADSQHSVISKSDIESVAHTQNKESAKENSAKERDTPKIIQHKRLVEIKQDVKEYGDEDFIAVMMSNGNDGVMA